MWRDNLLLVRVLSRTISRKCISKEKKRDCLNELKTRKADKSEETLKY